jgi:hypothetical protein
MFIPSTTKLHYLSLHRNYTDMYSSTLTFGQGVYSLHEAGYILLRPGLVWTLPRLQKCPQLHNWTRQAVYV